MDALEAEEPSPTTRRLIDMVDIGLPARNLELVQLGSDDLTLLGALRRGGKSSQQALSVLASELGENNCVACQLGLSDAVTRSRSSDSNTASVNGAFYQELRQEMELAWPSMRPGEVRGGSGATNSSIIAGRSPSGKERGDRYGIGCVACA